MRQKAMTLVVRMWQGPDGSVKASVKNAEGGEIRHFPDLSALMKYLEEAKDKDFWVKPSDSSGLR